MENHAKDEIVRRVKAVISIDDLAERDRRKIILGEFLNHRGGRQITQLPTTEYAGLLELIIPWEIEDRPKRMLEKIKQTGPVQTVMTETLIEGRHGNLVISSRGEDGVYIAVHDTDEKLVYMRYDEIHALAGMLTEIANFLDPASL